MNLRQDGHYVLDVPGVDLHGQLFQKLAFAFGSMGSVVKSKSGYLNVLRLKDTLPSEYATEWAGKYMEVDDHTIMFTVSVNNWHSVWTGVVRDNAIQFRIENPDFEDCEGQYSHVPLNGLTRNKI